MLVEIACRDKQSTYFLTYTEVGRLGGWRSFALYTLYVFDAPVAGGQVLEGNEQKKHSKCQAGQSPARCG